MTKRIVALEEKVYPVDPTVGYSDFTKLYFASPERKAFKAHQAKNKKIFIICVISAFIIVGLATITASFITPIIDGNASDGTFNAAFIAIFGFIAVSFLSMGIGMELNKTPEEEDNFFRRSQLASFQSWLNNRYDLVLDKNDAETLQRKEKLFLTPEQGFLLVDVKGLKHVLNFDGTEVPVKVPNHI